MKNKNKFKKYAKKVKKGFRGSQKAFKKYAPKVKAGVKGSVKAIKKYGPVAHTALRRTSESTMSMMATPSMRGRRAVDFTPRRMMIQGRKRKGKIKKIHPNKSGFYLDFT